jgi:hypothetical protein
MTTDGTAPGRDPLKEWGALISRRIAEVQEILRRSRPKAERYPTVNDCYHLAHVIEAIRVANTKKRKQRPYRAPTLLESMRKSVRELDKEIENARSELPPDIPPEILDQIIDQHYSYLRELETAKRTADAVIAHYEGPEPNPARSIHGALRETWQRAGVTLPIGVGPDDPLCREVTEILKLAGIHYAAGTVSGFLRVRETRPRSGGGRKSPEKLPT